MAYGDPFIRAGYRLLVFLEDWFGFECIEEIIAILMVIMTLTHFLGILMLVYQPAFTTCYDYFSNFTLIEIIAIFLWSLTLVCLHYLHKFDATHSRIVLNYVLYIHFVGLALWAPLLGAQWFMCINDFYKLKYGPRTMNGCINRVTNCYTSYFYGHMEALILSVFCSLSLSLYLFLMGKVDDFDLNLPGEDFGFARSARRGGFRRVLSLSDSLTHLYADLPRNEPSRRRRINSNSSNSDERIPLNRAASSSSDMEHERITLKRRENSMRGQPYEFEVHNDEPMETQV